MNRADRRTGRRFAVPRTEDVVLLFMIDDVTWEAPVIDLSKSGLRIELPEGLVLKPPKALWKTSLRAAGENPMPLGPLTVRSVGQVEGRATASLVTDDEDIEAALWYALTRLTYHRHWNPEQRPAMPPKVPRVPARGQYSEVSRLERLDFIRAESGAALAAFQETRLTSERLTGNIENMIGAIEVPVGLAGPLLFRGRTAQGLLYAPMATTEGALVASTTRGAFAITRCGGVNTCVLAQRMMRVPMFLLSSLEGAVMFAAWVRGHVEELREQTKLVSKHAELVSVEPTIIGRMVHVYFLYETADAAGQNMTTACTWQACQWLRKKMEPFPQVQIENFFIEGAMSGDKKVTYQSFIAGRGIRVVADCLVDAATLERVLKVTPEHLMEGYSAAMSAAIHIGMIGWNINVANAIAAIFTATGQDIACVHESGLGQIHLQAAEGGIYASLVLPSLIVGTVGGGTHLPGQQAALEVMGCAGTRKVHRLAEMIAGFALSLELSTMSAIASGSFATAHERLGRNRPVAFFGREELNGAFFEPGLRRVLGDPGITVAAVEPLASTLGSSIITELTARRTSKLVGLVPLRLVHTSESSRLGHADVVVKLKPLDEEVMLMSNSMAGMSGGRLAVAHKRHGHRTGAAGCHIRELAIYEQTDPRFVRHTPICYQTFRDDKREAYVLVLEKLPSYLPLLDTADNPRGWSRRHIAVALEGAAQLHSIWLGREKELRDQPWIGHPPTAAAMAEMTELWQALAVNAASEFPELIGVRELEQLREYIRTIPDWWGRIEELPRTLAHNDFNPRNVTLRDDDGPLHLCVYDWELATSHLPQHDLAELLCFVLNPTVQKRNVSYLVEVHREALERASGQSIDPAEWREGYKLALRDLAVNRFGLYLMAHTFRHYGFMERTVKTLWRLLELEEGRT